MSELVSFCISIKISAIPQICGFLGALFEHLVKTLIILYMDINTTEIQLNLVMKKLRNAEIKLHSGTNRLLNAGFKLNLSIKKLTLPIKKPSPGIRKLNIFIMNLLHL